MNTKVGIYLITNTEDGKVYLGSSINLKKRKYAHFNALQNGKHSNRHLQCAYDLYGVEAFQWEVLLYSPKDISDKELKTLEDYYINFFNALNPKYGYNFLSADRHFVSEETKAKMSASLTGKRLGMKHTEEARAKISASLKGKPSTFKGKIHTAESKEKNAAAHRGKPSGRVGKKASEETRMKLSISHIGNTSALGHKCSEEAKSKISAANKGNQSWLGKKHSEEAKARMSISQINRYRIGKV